MIAFRVTTDGNLRLSFESTGIRARDALRTSLARAGVRLLGYVKAQKLSGQVLKNRTGTLRRSTNMTPVQETGDRMSVQVGTNVAYAAAHEYGFMGKVTVRAHLRTIKQAFGRPIAAQKVQVRTFTRAMRLPERSFLRSSLRELAPALGAEITRAVVAAVEGTAP